VSKERNDIDYVQICLCSNLRKTSRVVTQLYDKLLIPTGLKITQYAMLVNINRRKDISISKLGEVMLLDQTTVTRNVNILKKSGFAKITKDKNDSRTKIVSITDLGIKKIKEATPIWLQIQKKIINDISIEKYKDFLKTLKNIQELIKLYES